MDSFDIYGPGTGGATKMLDGVYAELQAATPETTQVRTGTYALAMDNPGAAEFFRRIFGGNKTTVAYGLALYLDDLPVSGASLYLAKFLNGAGTAVCTVTVDTAGAIQVRTGLESGTVRGTSAPVIVASAWQHVEIKALFSATVGACEVRVNGVTVLNLSNINTDGAAGGVASNMACGHSSGGVVMYVDDIYCWDTTGSYNTDFIGDKKAYALFPNADTTVADWIPDTGVVGYSRINEATPLDTSYVQSDTAGDVSEYNFDDLPGTVSAIAAVQFDPRMIKTDAGVNTVQTAIVSGASSASGAAHTLTASATYYSDIFEQDPDTSTAWTRTGVNNAIARITRTA